MRRFRGNKFFGASFLDPDANPTRIRGKDFEEALDAILQQDACSANEDWNAFHPLHNWRESGRQRRSMPKQPKQFGTTRMHTQSKVQGLRVQGFRI